MMNSDKSQSALDTFNRAASAYQDRFMDLDLYNDTYDQFCLWVEKPGARLLEVGCGPGNITRYLLRKRPDFRIDATDFAPNMIALAQANNPSAHCYLLDCREIHTLPAHFDGVVCGFCMPYLSREDCAKLIRDSAALMPEGGWFYASTMEGPYEKSGFEYSSDGKYQTYIYYHQEDYLREMLLEAGFEIALFKRVDFPRQDGSITTDLVFIARKKP